MASIFDLFDNSNAQDAANSQIAGINAGTTAATNDLNTGLGLATGSYTAGLQPFMQNLQTSQNGVNAYSDALGLNGADGTARATSAFQTGPGYQFALDQGTQNAMRSKAASGQLASGSTDVDLQNLGQGMANQQWQQYLTNLQPFIGQSNTSAQGIGSLYSGLAGTQNSNLGQQASLQYGAATSKGNAQANADLANNAAAANIFGAVKSGVGLASNLIGFL